MPEIPEEELSDAQVLVELRQIKAELKDQVVVLGHHTCYFDRGVPLADMVTYNPTMPNGGLTAEQVRLSSPFS